MTTGTPQYFSDFGGTWLDRSDAVEEIERRVEAGQVSAEDAEQLRFWVDKGYVTLPSAVPEDAIDRFRERITRAFEEGDERLLVQEAGEQGHKPLVAGTPLAGTRMVDSYVLLTEARDILFAKPIVDFLRLVFGEDPLLMATLSFDRGSGQGMHQDSAYVVVSSPLEFCGVWIALEDVQEGSGELMYYEGSHRLPEYKFSGEYKHWNPERDGHEQHDEFLLKIDENAEKLGMPRRTFLPKKGDALVWAADLAHGGAPVQDPSLTRRSLVGHYCHRGVDPNWFSYRDDRYATVPAAHGAWLATERYDVSGEPGAIYPPGRGPAPSQDDPEPEPAPSAPAGAAADPGARGVSSATQRRARREAQTRSRGLTRRPRRGA